jgi:hypothetical protein
MSEERDDLIRSAPGLARIYATMWWHTAEWTVNSSLRAGSRLLRAAVRGGPPADLLGAVEEEVRDYARQLLGQDRLDDVPDSASGARDHRAPPAAGRPPSDLRQRGAELLRRSADVHETDDVHPAYERILEVLAPDEARILRLLATAGPQPSVDVRAGLPMASELVAPGRSMIGAEAGCRYPDRVRAYLNNLYRLGLIWFSREPIRERLRYQVLGAARGHRGAAQGWAHGAHGSPQHPPHSLRPRLLRSLPAPGHGRDRGARASQQRGRRAATAANRGLSGPSCLSAGRGAS